MESEPLTECKMIIDFSKEISLKSLFPQTEFEEKVISFLQEWFSESTTVKVQTSGSTGNPKIFDVEKKKMLDSAKTTCDILGLKRADYAIICLPIEYISGKMMVVRAIERGLKLVLKTPSSIPLSELEQEIDFCAMSPLQVENSLDKIPFIKNLIIGGAAISENLKNKIITTLQNHQPSTDNHQPRIYETYGMSETLSHIALKEIYPKADECFTVLDGIEISLDEKGCLKINAPKLNPEILQTNDLVEINEENQFKFLGRIDNVINSGGAKIFPEELEALVKKKIPNEVAFVGVPDEALGQKLILIVENVSLDQIHEKEIINHLSQINYQQKFHQPKKIIFIDTFPRFDNGKLNRLELLDLLKGN